MFDIYEYIIEMSDVTSLVKQVIELNLKSVLYLLMYLYIQHRLYKKFSQKILMNNNCYIGSGMRVSFWVVQSASCK